MTTAPNSLMARALHMMMPISMLRRARGKVTLQKVLNMEAPRLRDTFSSRGGDAFESVLYGIDVEGEPHEGQDDDDPRHAPHDPDSQLAENLPEPVSPPGYTEDGDTDDRMGNDDRQINDAFYEVFSPEIRPCQDVGEGGSEEEGDEGGQPGRIDTQPDRPHDIFVLYGFPEHRKGRSRQHLDQGKEDEGHDDKTA